MNPFLLYNNNNYNLKNYHVFFSNIKFYEINILIILFILFFSRMVIKKNIQESIFLLPKI